MRAKLKQLLEHLDATLDYDRQERIEDLFRRTLQWEPVERLPLALSYPLPDDAPFQPFPHREVFDDPEKMLYNELVLAFETSIAWHEQIGDDLPYAIRTNFGCVLIASLFGARVEQVEDNPPWVRHFETLEDFERVLDRDPCDLSQGWCPRVIEWMEFYRSVLDGYPTLQRCIRVVLPDLQGPIDTAELLRGSELYLDFYDRPDTVQRVLAAAATAQVHLARRLSRLTTDGPEGFCHQHAKMLAGHILVRDDSSIMISANMYREHIAPHDEFVLREMGGGGVHSCGNMNHLIDEMLSLPSIRSLDFGQSEMNDIDAIYAKAEDRKIALIRVMVPEEQLTTGRVLERFGTGVVLHHQADSAQDAARIVKAYMQHSRDP